MALAECGFVTGPDDRELTEHGTVFFPIACYHNNLALERVQWHWHEEMEAFLVTEGQIALSIEKESYILGVGAGGFINTGSLHAATLAEQPGCRLHCLVFHPRLVGGNADSVFWQNYLHPLTSQPALKGVVFDGSESWHAKALDAIETAWQAAANEPVGYEFQVREALSGLILQLCLNQSAIQKELPERELREAQRIRVMLQYIQEHYMEELNVAQVAASAMISESECLRCFHRTIGMPPVRYMKQFRIQKAAKLLRATNKKIGDIGAECGFLDTSYFTKVFREMNGCTPGEYRRRAPEYS